MTQDIVHLARSLQLDALETEWAAAVQAPRADQADRYAAAIDHLCDRDMTSKALSLASAMIEALANKSENAAAMELGFRVVRRNAHYEALTKLIGELIEKHYGKFLKTDRRAMFNEVAL